MRRALCLIQEVIREATCHNRGNSTIILIEGYLAPKGNGTTYANLEAAMLVWHVWEHVEGFTHLLGI